MPPQEKNSPQMYDNLLTFVTFCGLPKMIISDNRNEFKNHFIVDSSNLHKISLHFTIPRNSNSNSPVKRFSSRQAAREKNIETLMKFAINNYKNYVHKPLLT